MKKVIGVVALVGALFMGGCSLNSSPEVTSFENHMSMSKIKSAIIEAGEEAGWKMTRFKDNKIIAEKFNDGSDAKAVTISFNNHSFTLEPQDSELQDILEDKLH